MSDPVEIRTPTIRQIQIAVTASFGVSLLDLLSHRQGLAVARPRQVAMWLARHSTLHSYPEIGRHFGRRDHTTVMHAVQQIDRLMVKDAAFKAVVLGLLAAVDCGESVENRRAKIRVVA